MGNWQPERRCHQRIVVLVAQHKDSLGSKCCACSAVAAGAFHEVILLGNRGYLGAPYYPALH
jgi:hypothetical protein